MATDKRTEAEAERQLDEVASESAASHASVTKDVDIAVCLTRDSLPVCRYVGSIGTTPKLWTVVRPRLHRRRFL